MEHQRYKESVFDLLALVGKGIGSPRRQQILDILAQAPRTVEVLAHEADMSIANTSQHLRVLQRARLVESKKRGLYVTYRIADEEVIAFLCAAHQLAEHRMAEIGRTTNAYLRTHHSTAFLDCSTLKRRMKNGRVCILDVRPREEYQQGHIPGALSVPLLECKKRLKELPNNRTLVVCSRSSYCVLSVKAMEMLRKRGVRAVRLADGVCAWKAQGHRLVTGSRP